MNLKCKKCLTYVICRNKLTTVTPSDFDEFQYYRNHLIDCYNSQIKPKCNNIYKNYLKSTPSYSDLLSDFIITEFDLVGEISKWSVKNV